jgi:CRP-like cAMP-binding protein
MGAVGWEGFFSVGFLFDSASTSGEATVQIDGESWVLPRRGFQEWAEAFPEAERMLRRYGNAWMNQMGLHAACNAVHSVDERLVRWILTTHDRTPGTELHLTHEFLSIMLGVRRASVSVGAARLREAGLIDYTRGHIHVIDRARLELSSCSCYFAVRAAYDATGIPRLVDHLSSGVRLDS